MTAPLRALAALSLLLAAAPAPPLAPGLWEHSLVFALDSVNGSDALADRARGLIPDPKPVRECWDAAALADPRSVILGAGDQQCRFTRFTMDAGRIAAAGDCRTPDGRAMHVEGTGSYTASGYDFGFTGTGETAGLRLAFRGRDSGRRVGMCPAG